MKKMNSPSLGVLAVLVLSAIFVGGDKSTSAETGGPALNLHAENKLNDNFMTDATDRVKKRDLVITRTFDAPIELVWRAWTEPEYVMRWWGPTGFTSPLCKIDFREGGKFLFCMRAPKEFQGGQDFFTAGVYKKIVPMKLIEFS